MADQGALLPGVEQTNVKNKRVAFQVVLNGNVTAGSISGYVVNPGATLYLVAASLTAPADANFSGLTSTAAPSVLGLYITDGWVTRVHRAAVDISSIRSPSMTAGVVTLKGLASTIAGNVGATAPTSAGSLTAPSNIALQISCTTLNLNAQTQQHTFSVIVDYDVA